MNSVGTTASAGTVMIEYESIPSALDKSNVTVYMSFS